MAREAKVKRAEEKLQTIGEQRLAREQRKQRKLAREEEAERQRLERTRKREEKAREKEEAAKEKQASKNLEAKQKREEADRKRRANDEIKAERAQIKEKSRQDADQKRQDIDNSRLALAQKKVDRSMAALDAAPILDEGDLDPRDIDLMEAEIGAKSDVDFEDSELDIARSILKAKLPFDVKHSLQQCITFSSLCDINSLHDRNSTV